MYLDIPSYVKQVNILACFDCLLYDTLGFDSVKQVLIKDSLAHFARPQKQSY